MAELKGLMDRIIDLAVPRLTVFSPAVTIDYLQGAGGKEILFRHDPAPVAKKHYMDGSSLREFAFSIQAKGPDQLEARDLLIDLEAVFTSQGFISALGISEVRLTVVTSPVPIGQDGAGVTIQASSYKLEFFQEGH